MDLLPCSQTTAAGRKIIHHIYPQFLPCQPNMSAWCEAVSRYLPANSVAWRYLAGVLWKIYQPTSGIATDSAYLEKLRRTQFIGGASLSKTSDFLPRWKLYENLGMICVWQVLGEVQKFKVAAIVSSRLASSSTIYSGMRKGQVDSLFHTSSCKSQTEIWPLYFSRSSRTAYRYLPYMIPFYSFRYS